MFPVYGWAGQSRATTHYSLHFVSCQLSKRLANLVLCWWYHLHMREHVCTGPRPSQKKNFLLNFPPSETFPGPWIQAARGGCAKPAAMLLNSPLIAVHGRIVSSQSPRESKFLAMCRQPLLLAHLLSPFSFFACAHVCFYQMQGQLCSPKCVIKSWPQSTVWALERLLLVPLITPEARITRQGTGRLRNTSKVAPCTL